MSPEPTSPPADPSPEPVERDGTVTPERPIPRGCNPLVFGVVMATIQLVATIYFMRTC